MEFTRLPDETDEELLWRLGQQKDEIGTWDQFAEVMNQLTGQDFGESTWRKRFSGMKNVVDKSKTFTVLRNEPEVLTEDEKLRELERKKIQFRDQRNAWNKQNYNSARVEETLEILEQKFSEISRIQFPSLGNTKSIISTDRQLIICLSDLHIGQNYDSLFGKYNSDIARDNLSVFLNKVKEVAKMFEINSAKIVCLGDLISGNIHKTVQITNKENVIQQIKTATEYISSFCYECCGIFNDVMFYNVSGNHSRIDSYSDAIHDERLDDLIGWAVNLTLQHVENFCVRPCSQIDSGIVEINVCGNKFLGVHGDFDPMNKGGVSNLSMGLGYVPYAILRGHEHTPAFAEINGVKVVQAGCLGGSGDQYTVEKRLFGKPSQTMLVCNPSGIECIYNVEF